MSLRSIFVSLFLALAVARGEPALPAITRDAVQASLAPQQAAWTEAIATRRPRLFFSEPEWEQVRREVEALEGPRGALREAFFAKAGALLEKPLPVYQTPEQLAGKRGDAKTLYSAREELWQREVGDDILALALAGQLSSDRRYTARMRELVLAASDFPTWGQAKAPMGNNADLAAGHLLRGISAAYDWHRDAFSNDEQEKIRRVVSERAPSLLAGLYGNAFWARGFEENHNHVSVCGLGFAGIAFLGEVPEAAEWLAAARLNFQSVMKSLPSDGSSVEGVSYWAYGIGYILQYIEATRPIIDSAQLYESPFLKNAASFRLMASTSGFSGNMPWGDAVLRDWGSPQYILHGLASQYGDPDAAWLAANLAEPLRADACSLGLSTLWARRAPQPRSAPSELDARLTANDMATTRSGWGPDDYVLSIKAGFTNRNHSHLDAGALALAFGDEWVLVAPGYGKGGGEGAFWDRGKSGRRWNYFSNATESHATLLIDGKNQRFDEKARGIITRFFSSPEWTGATVDLSEAYHYVRAVKRQVVHRRGEYVLVCDSVEAKKPVSVEWLAQFRKETAPEANGDLLGRGTKGRVLIRLLDPPGTFSLRQPLSPTVDPPKPQFTYSATASGEVVRFAVLLQPTKSGSAAPPLRTKANRMEDGTLYVTITSPDWTDHLLIAESRGSLSLPAGDPSGRNGTYAASLAAVRMKQGLLASFLALDATSVEVPGFTFHSEESCDLAANRLPDGSWKVTRKISPGSR
jgi:hypothetical protein